MPLLTPLQEAPTGIPLSPPSAGDGIAIHAFAVPVVHPSLQILVVPAPANKAFIPGPAPPAPLVLYTAALGITPSGLPAPSRIPLDTPALGLHLISFPVHPHDSREHGTNFGP